MRRLILLIGFLLVVCCGCSAAQPNGEDPFVQHIFKQYPELRHQPYSIDTVKRIVDGDTFETKSGDKVRMIGMNTPEITNGKNEHYGQEATNFTQEKLEGKTVYLFQDAGNKDKYGRLLRYVFIESEEIMINELLVADGYANTMTIPPNVIFAKKFVAVEQTAREQNKGLWGKGDVAKQTPSAMCAAPTIKGNINAKNEKIYHIPGGRYYGQTKAEQLFCTEEEAAAAGFRKSKE